jgi:general L-amino acid transport system substrate-binding protein
MRFLLLLLIAGSAHAQSTLDAVRARGFVQCGVNTGVAGFSAPDSKGVWRGIDIDLCRAVAAAALGDANKARFTPLTAQQRFTALQSGEVDILARNTTWTLGRDTSLGLNFVGVNYYDGQGFMVPKKLNVKSAKQLNGATICLQPGTTNELNVADWFPRQQDDLQAGGDREAGGGAERLLLRPLRRLHHRPFGADRAARDARDETR